MYHEMGKVFKSFDTWSIYMLTSNENFETYFNWIVKFKMIKRQ